VQDDDEAAEALGTTPEQARAWRRGTERMDVADYMALTATVNVGLADSMRSGKANGGKLSAAAEALGVNSSPPGSDDNQR